MYRQSADVRSENSRLRPILIEYHSLVVIHGSMITGAPGAADRGSSATAARSLITPRFANF
jgi:hypothetical protein